MQTSSDHNFFYHKLAHMKDSPMDKFFRKIGYIPRFPPFLFFFFIIILIVLL